MSDADVKSRRFATSAEVEAALEKSRLARIGPDTRMQCKVCWHVYDPAEGCPEEGVDPGTPFTELPEHFICPDCGNGLEMFLPFDETIG